MFTSCAFLAIFLQLAPTVLSEFSAKCADQTPIPKDDEKLCRSNSTVWYQYSGSERCDGCCVTYKMIAEIEPDLVKVENAILKPNEKKPIVIRSMVRKVPGVSTYRFGNDPDPLILLDADCRSYVVSYKTGQDVIAVYSSKPDPDEGAMDSLRAVLNCNMEMFKYNPGTSCK